MKKRIAKGRQSIRNVGGWTLILSFLIIFPLAYFAPEASLGQLLIVWGMPYFWIVVIGVIVISELLGRISTGHWEYGHHTAKHEKEHQRYLWLIKVVFYTTVTSLLIIHFGGLITG